MMEAPKDAAPAVSTVSSPPPHVPPLPPTDAQNGLNTDPSTSTVAGRTRTASEMLHSPAAGTAQPVTAAQQPKRASLLKCSRSEKASAGINKTTPAAATASPAAKEAVKNEIMRGGLVSTPRLPLLRSSPSPRPGGTSPTTEQKATSPKPEEEKPAAPKVEEKANAPNAEQGGAAADSEMKDVAPKAEEKDAAEATATSSLPPKRRRKSKKVSWAEDAKLVSVTNIPTRADLIQIWDRDFEHNLPFFSHTLANFRAAIADTARRAEHDAEQRRVLEAHEALQARLRAMQPQCAWPDELVEVALPPKCRLNPNDDPMTEFSICQRVKHLPPPPDVLPETPPSPPDVGGSTAPAPFANITTSLSGENDAVMGETTQGGVAMGQTGMGDADEGARRDGNMQSLHQGHMDGQDMIHGHAGNADMYQGRFRADGQRGPGFRNRFGGQGGDNRRPHGDTRYQGGGDSRPPAPSGFRSAPVGGGFGGPGVPGGPPPFGAPPVLPGGPASGLNMSYLSRNLPPGVVPPGGLPPPPPSLSADSLALLMNAIQNGTIPPSVAKSAFQGPPPGAAGFNMGVPPVPGFMGAPSPHGMRPPPPSMNGMMPPPPGMPHPGMRMQGFAPPPRQGGQRMDAPMPGRFRGGKKKLCKYFNTPQGCRDGSSCLFVHER